MESKYKTNMCKQWTKHGKCSYFHRCMFAHGEEELKPKPTSPTSPKSTSPTSPKSTSPKSTSPKQTSKPISPKSPLNPHAKSFEVHKIEVRNEYDDYWKIIHDMILKENQQLRSLPNPLSPLKPPTRQMYPLYSPQQMYPQQIIMIPVFPVPVFLML